MTDSSRQRDKYCSTCKYWADIDQNGYGRCRSPGTESPGIYTVLHTRADRSAEVDVAIRTHSATYCKCWVQRDNSSVKTENDSPIPGDKMKKYRNGSLMVTPCEGKVLEPLREAWDKFCDLGMSKEDFNDFRQALTTCNRIIMARVVHRAAPDIFKDES